MTRRSLGQEAWEAYKLAYQYSLSGCKEYGVYASGEGEAESGSQLERVIIECLNFAMGHFDVEEEIWRKSLVYYDDEEEDAIPYPYNESKLKNEDDD